MIATPHNIHEKKTVREIDTDDSDKLSTVIALVKDNVIPVQSDPGTT